MRGPRIYPLILAALIALSPILLSGVGATADITYYYTRNSVSSLSAGAAAGSLSAVYLQWYWGVAITAWCGAQMLVWTAIWVGAAL